MNKPNAFITADDLARFHDAAKRIEMDADEAYFTCRKLYGPDIAGVLLVAFLRRAYGAMDSFPAKPEVKERTTQFLRDKGLLNG